MLGYYSPEDGWTIHITDTDANSASAGGWLEDTSKVKKYEMSAEEARSILHWFPYDSVGAVNADP